MNRPKPLKGQQSKHDAIGRFRIMNCHLNIEESRFLKNLNTFENYYRSRESETGNGRFREFRIVRFGMRGHS